MDRRIRGARDIGSLQVLISTPPSRDHHLERWSNGTKFRGTWACLTFFSRFVVETWYSAFVVGEK